MTAYNLSQSRLNNWSELNVYLQTQEKSDFLKFVNNAYKILLRMYPGEIMRIEKDVRPKNRDKFIKVACLFILEGHAEYEFSDDYSMIIRRQQKPDKIVQQVYKELEIKKNMKNELEQSSGSDNRETKGR